MNLQGMLIDRIENRVLVGITIFLASMVLVGWVAINETGRMASFQQQHLARSIEIGAELFASRCAECHGAEGRGSARAPGLNNPQLFGATVLGDIQNSLTSVDSEISRLENAISTLETADDTSGLTDEELATLETDVAAITEEFGENPIDAINTALTTAQDERQAIISPIQSAIDSGYDPYESDRLVTVDWAGTLDAFILTTLVGGRPVSSGYWPEPMPAWSQTAGGPMRMDQLENLTNYIVNWGANDAWTVDDLLEVQQFAKIPVEGGGTVAEDAVAPDVAFIQQADVESRRGDINAAVDTVMTEMQSMIGDPNNGQVLYNGALGCSACHTTAVAPTTDGTFTRVNETRLQDPALAGYSAEHYLIESILVPNAYVAPGFVANAMPQDFGEKLNAQELLDLVAYLESQDGPDPLAQ